MQDNTKLSFQRILLKLSGEAFLGAEQLGIDFAALNRMGREIAELVKLGVEVGIVLGGGNIFRGAALAQYGFNRITCDQMGMLATIMNGLALRDVLHELKLTTHLMSALPISGVVQKYDVCLAKHYLAQKQVVIFGGGTGNPFFTTDSAAALRGIEINADIILKATKVNGVYSADPAIDPQAEFFKHITYQEVLDRKLEVMDLVAICLCREHNKQLRVFNMNEAKVLCAIVCGSEVGTLVTN